ncbi:hypothetical protein [Metabacillus niabensis]|uniref:Uncharacterized protein n=1 Tax=Metabacillus niabensis TaxID=324854 RepID=A0ABT9ZBM7_9BACI|nr:hypothetical protein [Metabacillus niabensis]MDQ0228680.1 hypothetical protein [Metabacillus niabensis]
MLDILWYCYLGFLAIAAIGILITGYKKPFAILDFIISIITWIGLFGYVTNKPILFPFVWKIVFVAGLLWDVYFSFKKFNEEVNDDDETPKSIKFCIIGITFIILIGPLYFGLFHYAFK